MGKTLSMKTGSFLISLLVCLMIVTQVSQAELKRIHLITMGGAMSGTQKNALSGEFALSSRGAETVVASNIEILDLADITFEELYNLPSQEITHKHWIDLAKKIDTTLQDKSIDAVIITHGTDTIEETAYFLNLTVKTKKPIIITGAIRAALHPSSDSTQNLIDAIRVATHPNSKNRGVMVVANGKIMSAREIQKNHNHSLDALESSEIGILGYVHNEIIDFHSTSSKKHTFYSAFNIQSINDLPNVAIAYSYSGGANLNITKDLKGLVIAGVGSGNVDKRTLVYLKQLQKKDIQVVRSSRNIGAPVYSSESSEIKDSELNFIASNNLSPQKARILLMLALNETSDPKKIKGYFDTH